MKQETDEYGGLKKDINCRLSDEDFHTGKITGKRNRNQNPSPAAGGGCSGAPQEK
jgi:hypothetical protein